VLSLQLESISKKYKIESTTKTSKRINETFEEDIDNDTAKAHNTEGRFILCEFVLKNDNKFVLLGTYSPNSGVDRKNPLKRLAYRTLRWDFDIYNKLNELKKTYDNILWVGDLNVARKDNDISYKIIIAGTTQEERENFENFITNDNWIDTFDKMNEDLVQTKDRCTYGYDNKLKLRLDYIICSEKMEKNIEYSKIIYESINGDDYTEVSDHLPIIAKFIM
jgi:exodeoxyribonuclease III